MRKLVSLCAILAACGGTPSSPSDSPAPSNPESRVPNPGSPVVLTDDFGGRQLFPADNWWNQDITTRAARSAVGRLHQLHRAARAAPHPDFGPPPYGIPYVGVGGSQPRVPVTFVDYGSESDAGFRGETGYPIPDAGEDAAELHRGRRARRRNRRRSPPADRRSRPLAALRAVRRPLERVARALGSRLGRGLRPVANARRPEGWTSADAAGLAILPGLVRYDEAAARADPPRVPRDRARRPTATSGPRRIAPAAPLARCRWARACG